MKASSAQSFCSDPLTLPKLIHLIATSHQTKEKMRCRQQEQAFRHCGGLRRSHHTSARHLSKKVAMVALTKGTDITTLPADVRGGDSTSRIKKDNVGDP